MRISKKSGGNISVVGAMCISDNPEILKITIPNLIKHSDWVLLLLDNETPEVLKLALEIQKENYDKVWLRRSSITHDIINRGGKSLDYHRRWKTVKGIVRDEIFVNLRRIIKLKTKGYNNIDILLFPDADECFNDYLPILLESFWQSDYKAIALKHLHVYDNFFTVKMDKMRPHVHIFKWQEDLCGLEWQWQNQMAPITWDETMYADYYSLHLCYLTEEMRNWRNKKWKNVEISKEDLFVLDTNVQETKPEIIIKNLVFEYEKRLFNRS